MPDDDLNPFVRIWQRWLEVVQQETERCTAELMKDALDPARLMQLLRSMDVDFSAWAKLGGQQAGFDAYKVLGLDRSASDEEIKKRYRHLLHRLHPDTAGVEGTELLLQVVMSAYRQIAQERRWS